MFTYKAKILLKDTDATGVLYFSAQFCLALETFQEYLAFRGQPLKKLFEGEYLLPIVHAEGDYFAPLQVDDELEITLTVDKVGTSSLTTSYLFFDPKRQINVGRVILVQVAVLRETRRSLPLPEILISLFAPS